MTLTIHDSRLALAVCCAIVMLGQPLCGKRSVAEPHTEYQQLSTEFARSAFGWRPAAPAMGSMLFIAPDEYTPGGEQGDALRRQRDQYADSLFTLAQRAAAAGQLSLAFQWATEAVRENPDQAAARRVLGYERHGGRWLTPYGVRMAEAGKTWHAKFGWVAPTDVSRFEAGERLVDGRWLSAEAAAARHRDMKGGWQVRTDHYLITTNHSLEAAAELAARLERLHQVWRQLFAGFYLSDREVRGLFAGEREPRRAARPLRVYYHRDKSEYVAALERRQPRIAETLGIYFDAQREAHFFAADNVAAGDSPAATSTGEPPVPTQGGGPPAGSSTGEPPVATLYHEAVHQLFQETRPAAKEIGASANFWIVEGVATYFETLREHVAPQGGLYFTVGEAMAGRLPAARERLAGGFYLPLAELTQLGKDDVQHHPEIAKLYSQAAGLTTFLMHAEGGRYREPLVGYLTAVYAGRDAAETLATATGYDYSELDAAYRRFMQSLP